MMAMPKAIAVAIPKEDWMVVRLTTSSIMSPATSVTVVFPSTGVSAEASLAKLLRRGVEKLTAVPVPAFGV